MVYVLRPAHKGYLLCNELNREVSDLSKEAKALILTWVVIGLLVAAWIGFYYGRKTAPTQGQNLPGQPQGGMLGPQPSGVQQPPQGSNQGPAPTGSGQRGQQ